MLPVAFSTESLHSHLPKKTFTNQTLFISDLHLSLEKPQITRRFLDFLKNRAVKANELYILGDLFDTWVGDDDFMPPTHKIRKRLKHLTDSGIKVYLQQGNRDFLLGQRFCQQTGVILLDDHAVIDLYGTPTLLMHGDLLCTDDLPYQTFRIKSHSTEWQHNVLSKPLVLRLLVARWYRLRSHFHKRGKTQDIMDVNPNTVIETLRSHNCLRLIHGHTHRPNVHSFEIGGQTAQRFVLSEWHNDKAEILCWTNNGYHTEVV
jgi:UDP-2,3-diacylglucosamine hydrolase